MALHGWLEVIQPVSENIEKSQHHREDGEHPGAKETEVAGLVRAVMRLVDARDDCFADKERQPYHEGDNGKQEHVAEQRRPLDPAALALLRAAGGEQMVGGLLALVGCRSGARKRA